MADQQADERIAELEDRIEQLESTIRKMLPSRRDAMKLGGAAVIGAAAMSGTASAGSSQVGTIGDKDASPAQLVDIHAEDVYIDDKLNDDALVTARPTDPGGSATNYRIIKGSDGDGGDGIINFKTS